MSEIGLDGESGMTHGGRVYEFAERMKMSVESICDFSANMNPLGPPECVLSAITTVPLSAVVHYPDSRHGKVKAALANRHEINANMLFCGNGATEIMELIVRTVHPERVVVLEPAFSEYAAIAHRYRTEVKQVSLLTDGAFHLPVSDLDTCLHKGDLIFLNHPHNPSGSVFVREEWEEAARAWSRRGVSVVCDESFIDFLPNEDDVTAISLVREEEHIFVIRSATKMYAIPGIRFGYGIGHPKLVADIERERDPWSVNQIAQVAALAAYQDTAFVEKTKSWLKQEQAYIKGTWGKSKWIRYFEPQANFFLVRFHDSVVAQNLQRDLQNQRIFLRDCSDFTYLDKRYVRIGIRSHAENERLWLAVTRFFDG